METDYPAIFVARFGAALCGLVFLYGALLFDAVADGLFGYGHVVLPARRRNSGPYLRAIQVKTAPREQCRFHCECFERLKNHQRLAHHHGNQDQPADHENTETQQDDIGG